MIGGEAGDGITRSGLLLAKAFLRGGLHIFGANDYQSTIRGGHNFYILRVKGEEVYSQGDLIDLLIALNEDTITRHEGELVPGGGVIYDGEQVEIAPQRGNLKLYSVPLRRIVQDLRGRLIMRNTVALGAAIALLNYDLTLLEEVLRDTFEEKVAELNVAASESGYNYIKENYSADFGYRLERQRSGRKVALGGNEAIGLGAISGGCRFYAAYPMTPASGLLHFMADQERNYDMVVLQAENEIASINMIVGASFAGVRAMTATSGGGFCLMSEGFGQAAEMETPIVVMVGQRPGPSTGLPTYTAQGDLRFVLHASQGEFPRVIIAPGDVEECFYETIRAFNLAEKYQLPVVLLADKHLLESHFEADPFDPSRIKIERGELVTEEYRGEEEYKRYKFTESGISPRAIPGTKGAIVLANSTEHSEYGYSTENPVLTTKMNEKRFRKLSLLVKELDSIATTKLYGPRRADVTIISWGSTKGPVREAVRLLEERGITANFLQVLYLEPFPTSAVARVLETAKKTVVVENNLTSQLSSLIREKLLREVDHKVLKYDGRPFNPGEISKRIEEVM
ncbi:MAG: 2-oxoacid:acceptor oxidoreductase subunit alpha [Candidatus Bathyarchaeia archaeon]